MLRFVIAALRGFLVPLALSVGLATGGAATEDWEHDWTVLTLASSGAWGGATAPNVAVAMVAAIRDCRSKPGGESDCGAQMTTTRAGWSLGYRCGEEVFLVAEKTLDDARTSALYREIELRQLQKLDMPPCDLVVAGDPAGTVNAGRPVPLEKLP